MNIKPILFSTPMVQAIMEGRKTQTRRVIKPQPDDSGLWDDNKYPRSLDSELTGWNGTVNDTGEDKEFKCPYPVGTILWVREKWNQLMSDKSYMYYASYDQPDAYKWKPSIFMPREAARIFLQVSDVRVERLQDISQEDAKDEGITPCPHRPASEGCTPWINKSFHSDCYKCSFRVLWNKINGKKHPWDSNPWVWVYTFKQILFHVKLKSKTNE